MNKLEIWRKYYNLAKIEEEKLIKSKGMSSNDTLDRYLELLGWMEGGKHYLEAIKDGKIPFLIDVIKSMIGTSMMVFWLDSIKGPGKRIERS